MDKGEPSLVPEWLRSSGHASSGVSSSSSSSSHSDSASLQHNSRNKNSRSKCDVESIHSPFLDRSSSINSRRVSSNGSAKHAYSSFNFNRSQRDKDRSRGSYVDQWDLDTFIPILTGRNHDPLTRSHSMVTRKQGILPGPSIGSSFQRTGFDKDFPSLGADEKHGGQEVIRVSSPGVSSVVQSLPVGNSALIGGEGWKSALAEVPNVIEKACSGPLTSPKANVSTRSLTGPTGLNMAEALVQAPPRINTPPQGIVKTQRFEDLAIKQSRQLIPVVPSTPKCLSLSPSDKCKTKQVSRTGETCLAPSRNAKHQPPAMLGNFQSNSSGQIKTEKKLLVLKPARENGVADVKESQSPSGNTNRASSSQLMTIAQSTESVPVKSTKSPKELKGATTLTMILGQTVEKKSSSVHTQSRNAFFSALKQKTTSTHITTSTTCISSSVKEKVNNSKELVASNPSSLQATSGLEVTQGIQMTSQVAESNTTGFEAADTPDEKEAEFLRSLGWDENNSEDEALTEEEIKAFVEQYKKLKPSVPQNLPIIQEARENM